MAITFNQIVYNQGATATLAASFTNAVSPGDLIVAQLAWATITTAKLTPTISDNVNAGSWNIPSLLSFYGNPGGTYDLQQQICWIRCDTAGTPTVTAGALGTQGTSIGILHYTGFSTGHPTLVTADCSSNNGYTTAPSASSVINSVSNELSVLAASCAGGQNFTSVTGSFTNRGGFGTGDPGVAIGDVVKATTGNTLNFGATITLNNWVVMLASFQDLASGPSPTMYVLESSEYF